MKEIDNQNIIGSSWMTYDGRRTHLHHFAIHPSFQGKGLGKILLNHSLKHAKEQGSQMKIELERSNTKATKLYTNAGFNRLGDYDVYIKRTID